MSGLGGPISRADAEEVCTALTTLGAAGAKALVAGASAITWMVQAGAGASHTEDVPAVLRGMNAIDSYGQYLLNLLDGGPR